MILPSAFSVPVDPSLNLDGDDEWDPPMFAFHELDYIPSGFSGILAPYIETGPGTMRAAAVLMNLSLPSTSTKPTIVCDLGCGDGEFLIGMLRHLNSFPHSTPTSSVHGFGVDYNESLISTATTNAKTAKQEANWLVYDFNADSDDLFSQLERQGVTHVFVYLVPKQLALATVRGILEKLVASGVCVCCHKFQPQYLVETRRDILMDLVAYERAAKMQVLTT
ncbi:hypothetical protein P7C70_g8934, partial [Phenoliferia sp. Uapishka_3]